MNSKDKRRRQVSFLKQQKARPQSIPAQKRPASFQRVLVFDHKIDILATVRIHAFAQFFIIQKMKESRNQLLSRLRLAKLIFSNKILPIDIPIFAERLRIKINRLLQSGKIFSVIFFIKKHLYKYVAIGMMIVQCVFMPMIERGQQGHNSGKAGMIRATGSGMYHHIIDRIVFQSYYTIPKKALFYYYTTYFND